MIMGATRKQQIILEAIQATSELGFQRTNARSVATRLAIQPSNVFYYFASEKQLTIAMLEHILLTNDQIVSASMKDGGSQSFQRKLNLYCKGNIEWAFEHSEHVGVLTYGLCEGRSHPELLDLINTALKNGEDKIFHMLAAGVAEDEFSLSAPLKPREIASTLHHSLIGFILRSATSRSKKADYIKRFEALLRVFIKPNN